MRVILSIYLYARTALENFKVGSGLLCMMHHPLPITERSMSCSYQRYCLGQVVEINYGSGLV